MATLRVLFSALVCIVPITNGKIPDMHVTCLVSKDCLLPCTFKPAAEEVIGWFRQDVLVHSFAQGSSQLDKQGMHFRGRTALFPEQIIHGNASLLLRLCNTQDRGWYRCHVTTTLGGQESFVIAKVEAPVQSLNLEMTRLSSYDELKCSASDVYPAPHVLWFTVPPEPLDTLKPVTRKMANKNGLYSVESKLRKLQGKDSNIHTYFCTVNSSYDTQTWRASLQERELSSEEGGELTIPCLSSVDRHNFTLTWTFTRADKPENIITFDSQTSRMVNRWAGQAKVDDDEVLSGDGSLLLQNLQNAEHAGTYTCTFSTARSRHMVFASVSITTMPVEKLQGKGSSWLWVIAVVLAALIVLITMLLLFRKKKADRLPVSKPAEGATEMQAVATDEKDLIKSENNNLTKDQTDESS